MAMMGSINQVVVPLGIAVYFLWWRRDVLAGALCLAWASTSAQNASVYIGDAPYERLQLIGGFHDWAFVLGPEHFNMLDRAAFIAACVKGFGIVLWLTAFGLCCAGPFLSRSKQPAAPSVWLDDERGPVGPGHFVG